MNGIMSQVLAIATLPVELFVASMLYCQPLRHRERYPMRIVTATAVSSAMIVMLIIWLVYSWSKPALEIDPSRIAWEGLSISLGYSLIAYLLAVLLIAFLCAVSMPEAIYCATCAYLTQHITYCLHSLLAPGMVEGEADTYTVWYFVIYGLSYWGASRLIARRIATNGGYHTGLGRSLRLTASALAVALVLSAVEQHLYREGVWSQRLCLIYGACSCFFVLWGQLSQQRQLALQHELDLQQQLWLKHKTQYELSTQNVELINRKCHDLKHQIAALKLISDQSKRDESIRSLEESVMIYDSMLETGNTILDTVLTEKSLICEAKGIELTCIADGASLNFMDAVDIYTIFGNALDNAIESVSALKDPEQRAISVTVFSKADLVILQMENYYSGGICLDGELPQTTKEEELGYHGFGLKSIRYTAEKYGGIMSVQTENQIFLLRVSIPVYQDK